MVLVSESRESNFRTFKLNSKSIAYRFGIKIKNLKFGNLSSILKA